jgi:hypothetical protein
MNEKEKALAIASAFRRLQATEIAYRTLVSQFRLNDGSAPEDRVARDVREDLDPLGPYGPTLQSFALQLGSANPSEVLDLLYEEIFDPKSY